MKPGCPAWLPPLLAIQFLTRLPVPALAGLSGQQARAGLQRAVVWFPLVGTLVGAATAATLLLAEQIWPRMVAVILALIVEARLTGAFHEDAVADFCDALGGGRDETHVRQIMKDSRIGSFGALGLMLGVGLRAALMVSLSAPLLVAALIAAATFGRLFMVIVMAAIAPSPMHEGLAKSVGAGVRARDVALASLVALPGLSPFAVHAPTAMLFASVAAVLFLFWFKALLARRVGGSTGDCIGFAAYAGQLILFLSAAAAW